MKTPPKEPLSTTRARATIDGQPPSTGAVDSVDGAVYRSEGHRLLCVAGVSLGAMAKIAGVSKQAASGWKSGGKLPAPAARAALEAAYGIPASSWTRKPSAAGTQPRPSEPPSLPAATVPAASTMAGVLELLGVAGAGMRDPDLEEDVRRAWTGEYSKALALKHRLEREAELLEDRVVREHPMWRRLRAGLLRTLARHPRALADVVELLKSLQADDR